MRIAVIGAGYVADFYALTLQNYPHLQIAGVWDIDTVRLSRFCTHYGLRQYSSLDAALSDPGVAIVANLASAHAHYEITGAALIAGRHVYSEKPIALRLDEAEDLVRRAQTCGLYLSSAPANGLGPAFRKVMALIAAGQIGTPRLAYAALEDGPVFRQNWAEWQSTSGARWPGLHEFQVGCTLEHAGYALSWLLGLFGGVDRVIAHAALVAPDKGSAGDASDPLGFDYSCGSLIFENGMVARLTCGLTAPRDHAMTIFGELGTITVSDLRDSCSSVYLRRNSGPDGLASRVSGWINRKTGWHVPYAPAPGRRQRLDRSPPGTVVPDWPSKIDFAAGLDDLAVALRAGRPPRLANEWALHLTEIALRLDGAGPRHGFSPDTDTSIINRLLRA